MRWRVKTGHPDSGVESWAAAAELPLRPIPVPTQGIKELRSVGQRSHHKCAKSMAMVAHLAEAAKALELDVLSAVESK
jgi:hypothetical protein